MTTDHPPPPSATSAAASSHPPAHHGEAKVGALALAALGVVFGDIGTSPLYAFKECISGPHGVSVDRANVLGVLSLIFYALLLVVTVKYLTVVMRADNRGEGGILALLALVPERMRPRGPSLGGLAGLVLFGAALLYGDGIITPAISVLSAVEGIEVATAGLKELVVPVTVLILIALFAIQKHGTSKVGRVFGPVMLLWFGTIGALGVAQIVREPGVLAALSPHHAVQFFLQHGWHGALVLGAVVLAITGGEALYADMGHFGRKPIKWAWYAIVLPSLLLNYLGQGALMLRAPGTANPFYGLVSGRAATYALVVLATAATIIASQALISGAFSLTQQAVQLGVFPRVSIQHTSSETEGQIYIPEINWGLAVACIALVFGFGASSRLAAAYGIAVTGTMVITTVAWFVVAHYTWRWPLWKSVPLLLTFLAVDLGFLLPNTVKIAEGGYVPIAVAIVLFVVMANWKMGRALLGERIRAMAGEARVFFDEMKPGAVARVRGCAVFMASSPDGIPPILLHHVRYNKALHDTVLLVTILTEHVPKIPAEERLEVSEMGHGLHRVIARYGFMEHPNIPAILRLAVNQHALPADLSDLTFYIGRETLLATNAGRMNAVAEKLFAFLSRNAPTATSYFSIPADRVVEIGFQLDL